MTLSREYKLQVHFHRIDSLTGQKIRSRVEIKQLMQQLFYIDKSLKKGSDEIIYSLSNDVKLDKRTIETIQKKEGKLDFFIKYKIQHHTRKIIVENKKAQGNTIFISLLQQ